MSRVALWVWNALKSHLLAKFFAVVFAGVTILLIDRYQNETVTWLEQGLPVLTAEVAARSPKDEVVVVLSPDAGVVFVQWPRTVELRIRGPKKQKDFFLKNVRRIELRGRLEWAERGRESLKPVQWTLRPEDFFIPELDNVELLLLEPVQVTVDQIEEVEQVVPTLLPPPAVAIPVGRAWDPETTVFTPETVRVRGPRALVARYGSEAPGGREKLPVELVPGSLPGPMPADHAYPVRLPENLSRKGIEILGSEHLQVTLGFKAAEQDSLDLGAVTVFWELDEQTLGHIQQGRLSLEAEGSGAVVLEAKLVLRGDTDVVSRWRGRMVELRKRVHLDVDANDLKTSVTDAMLGGKPVQRSLPLRARGLPQGLEVESITPAELDVRAGRKDKKD